MIFFYDIWLLSLIISQRDYIDPWDGLSESKKRYVYLSNLG